MLKIKELIKDKSLEKTAFLPRSAVACDLAKVEPKENGKFEILSAGTAICIPTGVSFGDVLTTNFYVYGVYKNFDEIKQAYENGELHPGETFCYSTYDCYEKYPDLKKLQTKDEIIEFLKRYNTINNTTFYWTFLDKDEIEKLNETVKRNLRLNY